MQIVSFNWRQYAGRVWSHTNSAQPPNSHLAPKLKINTAHWNNSLHIGGTWYCPSDPYTSSPPLAARTALTRRGMLSTRVRTLPGRTAAHAWWTALFSSARVEGVAGGFIHVSARIKTDTWSQTCSVGFMSGLRAGARLWPRLKRLPCHVLYGAGHCLGRTQSYVQTPPSPMTIFDS